MVSPKEQKESEGGGEFGNEGQRSKTLCVGTCLLLRLTFRPPAAPALRAVSYAVHMAETDSPLKGAKTPNALRAPTEAGGGWNHVTAIRHRVVTPTGLSSTSCETVWRQPEGGSRVNVAWGKQKELFEKSLRSFSNPGANTSCLEHYDDACTA